MHRIEFLKKRLSGLTAGILILAILIVTVAFSGCTEVFQREIPTKDALQANVFNDGKWDSVARYLYEWNFPTFNDDKFLAVEGCVDTYYCGEMPDKYTLAKVTAELFLEHFYDGTDLGNSTDVTDALLTCYMASFGDDYAVYRNASAYKDFSSDMSGTEKFVGIGVRIRKSEEGVPYIVSVNNGSPAEAAGFKRGDVVTSVDGVLVSDVSYEEIINMISGTPGETVSVSVRRGDVETVLAPVRAEVPERTVIYSFDAESSYGLIEILSFKENTADEFRVAVDELIGLGARGLVFDLRNNLGGILSTVVAMISYLVDDGLPVVSYQYNGMSAITLDSGTDGHAVKVPVVLIVNEYTASAAEIFAASLRDYELMEGVDVEVTIVGKKTFGKGVMQRVFTFADGSAVTVTVAYYDPPLGVNYHGEGVHPDVEIEDRLTVSEGDAQLEAAYRAMDAYFTDAAA